MFIIAYNEHGRTVNAHDLCATPELRAWARKSRFECVECAERHPVHICFRDLEKAELRGRTTHRPAWWHHRGGGGIGSGGGAAESERHWHAKHILSEHVGRYSFVTSKCNSCERHTAVEAGADATGAVEYEQKLAGGRSYRFDAVLLQGARVRSVLEVWESHETSAEKRAHCQQLGYTFGEFDARHVVQQHEQAQGAPYTLQNLKIAYFECSDCAEAKVRRHEWRRMQAEQSEREELQKRTELHDRLDSELQELLRIARLTSERAERERGASAKNPGEEKQRLERERAERESALSAKKQGEEKQRLETMVLNTEAECVRYADRRRALNAVIARKTQNSECWEEERLAHNKLLALELDADSRRMQALVRMRRMGLTETKYH
jgi:hypothetical protein